MGKGRLLEKRRSRKRRSPVDLALPLAGREHRVALQRQFEGAAGFGGFVDGQDHLDGAAAFASVDFIRVEPRGEGIDSAGLTTVQNVDDGGTLPIEIPLTSNFQIVATGHLGDFTNPVEAIGVSAETDLTTVEGTVTIRVPFAKVDELGNPGPERCQISQCRRQFRAVEIVSEASKERAEVMGVFQRIGNRLEKRSEFDKYSFDGPRHR